MKTIAMEMGEYKGYKYLIKRWILSEEEKQRITYIDPRTFEHFCGYAELTKTHTLYGVSQAEWEEHFDIYVHGGITFNETVHIDRFDGFLSERTEEYEYFKDKFLIGFDCGHAYDHPDKQDLNYTRSECYRLIDQLIEIQKEEDNESN